MTLSVSIVTFPITTLNQQEIQARLANKQTTADEKLMYIKAIGNAGSSEAIEELHKILRDREQPLRIRVECAWALRRILPAAREKVRKLGPCVGGN